VPGAALRISFARNSRYGSVHRPTLLSSVNVTDAVRVSPTARVCAAITRGAGAGVGGTEKFRYRVLALSIACSMDAESGRAMMASTNDVLAPTGRSIGPTPTQTCFQMKLMERSGNVSDHMLAHSCVVGLHMSMNSVSGCPSWL